MNGEMVLMLWLPGAVKTSLPSACEAVTPVKPFWASMAATTLVKLWPAAMLMATLLSINTPAALVPFITVPVTVGAAVSVSEFSRPKEVIRLLVLTAPMPT